MNVTVSAKCWDGVRRKALTDVITVEAVTEPEIGRRGFASAMRDPRLKALLGYAVPIAFLVSGLPPFGLHGALAASIDPQAAIPAMSISDGIRSTILHSFDPLIDLIQALSYPIAGVMIAGGCLFIMVGNREKGMSMLQNAAIGYILVQLSPMLLKLLVGIGESV